MQKQERLLEVERFTELRAIHPPVARRMAVLHATPTRSPFRPMEKETDVAPRRASCDSLPRSRTHVHHAEWRSGEGIQWMPHAPGD